MLADRLFESVGSCRLCTSSRQRELDEQKKYGVMFRSAEAAIAYGNMKREQLNRPLASEVDDERWAARWATHIKRSTLIARLRQTL